MTTIVIPLHHKGGKLKDNTELRFALRSLEKNFLGEYEVVIVGKVLPPWLAGVKHLYAEGLKSALVIASRAFPEGFLWWYDDLCLLVPMGAEGLKITPCSRSWGTPKTGWGKKLQQIKDRLDAEGIPAFCYSRPHGPYWFDKSMVDEGFNDWPKMAGKFPWESWILSKRNWPRCYDAVRQYYGEFKSPPGPKSSFLNYNNAGFTPEMRKFLEKKFPEPSTFEELRRPNPPPVSLEIHTLRYGSHEWLEDCAPTLDAWCAKHGHPLRVWSEEEARLPEYPTTKFVVISMLKAFLEGASEWMGFFDADIHIHPDTQSSPDLAACKGLLMRQDTKAGGLSFPDWVRDVMLDTADPCWIYRNSGVWFCDRETAVALLEEFKAPFHECVLEQHQFNYALMKLAHRGISVHHLPQQWNAWIHETNPVCCYHLAGKKKEGKLAHLRLKGLIPDKNAMIWKFDPSFDFGPFGFTLDTSGWAMDLYHINLLHAAVTACGGVAMEIGSYRGASTSAFVTAINEGRLQHLHIVEPKPTDSLRRVIGLCRFPEKITLWTKPSWEINVENVDLVFIDGDHRFPAFADVMHALRREAKVIITHDSAERNRVHASVWGAASASWCLAKVPSYHSFEDAVHRKGLGTDRGFMVASKDLVLLEDLKARKIWSE